MAKARQWQAFLLLIPTTWACMGVSRGEEKNYKFFNDFNCCGTRGVLQHLIEIIDLFGRFGSDPTS